VKLQQLSWLVLEDMESRVAEFKKTRFGSVNLWYDKRTENVRAKVAPALLSFSGKKILNNKFYHITAEDSYRSLTLNVPN
jgi:hypothetical protein